MERIKFQFGVMGTICLFLIIPIKALRWVHTPLAHSIIVGVAPSLLAPAGFMFLILSSSGKLSSMKLPQLGLSMATVSLLLEFIQLLPRPGILAKVYYTFDWLDVIATLVSVGGGYWAAKILLRHKTTN